MTLLLFLTLANTDDWTSESTFLVIEATLVFAADPGAGRTVAVYRDTPSAAVYKPNVPAVENGLPNVAVKVPDVSAVVVAAHAIVSTAIALVALAALTLSAASVAIAVRVSAPSPKTEIAAPSKCGCRGDSKLIYGGAVRRMFYRLRIMVPPPRVELGTC